MKIEILPDADAVARKAAEIIAAEARAAVAGARPFCHGCQRRPHAVANAACFSERRCAVGEPCMWSGGRAGRA